MKIQFYRHILLIALANLFLVACSNQSQSPATINSYPQGQLQASYVCFVNNRYMGKEQILVEVEGKKYYGCCMGCVERLKNEYDTRYATDPRSGNEVDKALAYIVMNPDSSGEVFYFESENNYEQFKKNNLKTNHTLLAN